MPAIRYLLCLLGIIIAIPLLILIILALKLPITISGVLYLTACIIVATGLITAPLLPEHFIRIILAGAVGLFLIIVFRVIAVGQNQTSDVHMITLPEGKGPRWVGAVIDEQDGLIFGEELFHIIGGDSANEHEGLVPAFTAAFSGMKIQGLFPSPIFNTYLNLQQPNAFDAVIIVPKEKPKFGVIFLHGYMGNVTAQCWEIAQAVKELGGVTVCPSTEWAGQWWKPGSREMLKITFDYIREQGIQKIYLGGFSNGGFSMGRMASELEDEEGLAGLFFIDGFINGTEIKELSLPVLIIEGTQDERVPPVIALQFATEVGELGTYVEIDSDHFLIMKQPKQVHDAIASWLNYQFDP